MSPPMSGASRIPFSGYAVQFSPFRANLLAVASSQYYGIAGNGRVSVLDTDRNFQPIAEFLTRDGCFDVAFSEKSDVVLAAATGDGSVRLFDMTRPGDRPLAVLAGHTAETYSVDWNMHLKDLICSASWDKSVRVWDTAVGTSTLTAQHAGIAYEAKWNPRNGKLLASVGGDGMLMIHEMGGSGRPVQTIPAHLNEVLCVDWNKCRDGIIATGSVDKQIRIWDMRNPSIPVTSLEGHQLAVRRVKWSPHSDSLLCSCSYDMSVKLWNGATGGPAIDTYDHHTEFVVGLDFSNFKRDLVASTGWDRLVATWTLGAARLASPVRRPQQVQHRPVRQAAA